MYDYDPIPLATAGPAIIPNYGTVHFSGVTIAAYQTVRGTLTAVAQQRRILRGLRRVLLLFARSAD